MTPRTNEGSSSWNHKLGVHHPSRITLIANQLATVASRRAPSAVATYIRQLFQKGDETPGRERMGGG